MRGRVIFGIALLLVGSGTIVWQTWPDLTYRVGLVPESHPYVSRFAPEAPSAPPEGRRLVVPKIAVDVEVLEGDADQALDQGVYRHAESALPGESGNAVIAGHRDRRRLALLYVLEPGDAIVLYWDGREYDYRVRERFVVTADDASILDRGSTEQITIYTCLPRFLGDKRVVVHADPVTR